MLAALALAGPAHASPPPAAANALQSIEPADGAVLSESPDAIVLTFQQEMKDDDFPSIDLTCGEHQDTGLAERDDDNLMASFAINHELPRGVCIVAWRLTDGLGATIVADQITFRVEADPSSTVPAGDSGATTATTVPGDDLIRVTVPPISTDSSAPAEGSSGGALWLGRMLSTLGILVVFGALALISVGWPEGPEYIVTVRFLRTAWFVGLAGTVLYLIAFAAEISGESFANSVSPTAWLDLSDAGWPGRGALLRLAFVAASGLVALRPERIIDPTSAMWAWGVPGMAVVTVALSRVEGSGALLGFGVGVLHAAASAVWIGGVALVARVVLAGPGDEDLVQATRAFSRISLPAIVVTCVSGIVQMLRLDGGELFTSGHGRVVLLKVIAVAVMIAVGLAVRQQVGYRLARAHELSAPMADRFRRAFGAEATLGVVVLAFSGWLLALTPPTADPLAGERYTREIAFVDPVAGLDAQLSIGPATVGRNGFKLEVDAPEAGLSNVRLRFKPPAGAPAEARFWIDQPVRELTGAGIAYLDDSRGIPLLASGTWTVELTAVTPTGSVALSNTFIVQEQGGGVITQPVEQPTPNVSIVIVDPPTNTADFATTPTPSPTPTTPVSLFDNP